ncbi:S8 family serine peptidase [Halobacteria archaeon HArc-gm2]|nr:S8 family serine peptidase [Halobacteria archaeon HArc-gm2]
MSTCAFACLLVVAAMAGSGVATGASATPASAVEDTTQPPSSNHAQAVQASPETDSGGEPARNEQSANASVERVTLITGDTVVVTERSNETTYRVLGSNNTTTYDSSEGTYVIPHGVNLTRFDRALFNVDLLRQQGYTDAESDAIPLIVRWSNRTNFAENNESVTRSRRTARHHLSLPSINGTAIRVNKTRAGSVYRKLAASPDVQTVYYDAKVRSSATPAIEAVGADRAREQFDVTGEGVRVAVLDSGVDETHPAINGSEVGEVDLTDEGTTRDLAGHGTNAASIITGNDTTGNETFVGVAPDSSILDVRVLDEHGYGSVSNVILGIEYATSNDADVISMSLGMPPNTTRSEDVTREQVKKAVNRNITVVASGGEFSGYEKVTSPGTLNEVLTVGIATAAGSVPDGTPKGPTPLGQYVKPDVVAPGDDVRSARAGSDGYESRDGTSFAAPAASGTAALATEVHPNWTPDRIRNAITTSADPIDDEDVYSQGAGQLNATAALDVEIVADPATVDFGRISPNESATRTVTVHNLGEETKTIELSATATEIDSGERGHVAVNRSTLTIAPNGSARFELAANTDEVDDGTYSGRIDLGDATAVFGYVIDPERSEETTVTVTKRGLGNVSGDSVSLLHEESMTLYGPKPIDGGYVTFKTDLSGNYTAFSTGTHDGQPVITVAHGTAEGTVVLDERDTVERDLDASSLSESGASVHNRTVGVVATYGSELDAQVAVDDADAAAVRVSPDTGATYTVRRVLTVGSRGAGFDTPKIYHLKTVDGNVTESRTRSVDVDELATYNVSYYRGNPNESYSATVSADQLYPDWYEVSDTSDSVGSRFQQTIYVSPNVAQYHAASGDAWVADSVPLVRTFEGSDAVSASVRKHPFRSKLGSWSVNDSAFSAEVFPTVGQGPGGYVVDNNPAERYEVGINGDRVSSFELNRPTASVSETHEDIESVSLTVRDRNAVSPLSNRTVTTFSATTDGEDDRPPAVPDVSFESQSASNVVPNETLAMDVSATDAGSGVENVTTYVAERDSDGSPSTTPFENESGWREVELTRTGEGQYTAHLDESNYRGALSVALRVTDEAGNAVETTAIDGVVVGSRVPTATGRPNATLVGVDDPTVTLDASGSYDDASIERYEWDVDGDGEVDETTTAPAVTGAFSDTGTTEPTVTVVDTHGFEHTTTLAPVTTVESVPTNVTDSPQVLLADATAVGERLAADHAASDDPHVSRALDEIRDARSGYGDPVHAESTDPLVDQSQAVQALLAGSTSGGETTAERADGVRRMAALVHEAARTTVAMERHETRRQLERSRDDLSSGTADEVERKLDAADRAVERAEQIRTEADSADADLTSSLRAYKRSVDQLKVAWERVHQAQEKLDRDSETPTATEVGTTEPPGTTTPTDRTPATTTQENETDVTETETETPTPPTRTQTPTDVTETASETTTVDETTTTATPTPPENVTSAERPTAEDDGTRTTAAG